MTNHSWITAVIPLLAQRAIATKRDLTADGEALETNCGLSRRAARLRGEAGAECGGDLGNRRDISGNDDRGQRAVAMLGRIDEPIEGCAVAARRAMGRGRFDDVVVAVNDVRDGIQRERQHHGDERSS